MHWIEELGQSGMRPILHILETIDLEDNISSTAFRLVAYEREAYWIDKYLNLGAPLLNTLGVTRRYPQLGNKAKGRRIEIEDVEGLNIADD